MGLNRETQSRLDSIPRLESEIVKQSNLATYFRDKYSESLDVIEAKALRIAELEAENAALKAAHLCENCAVEAAKFCETCYSEAEKTYPG